MSFDILESLNAALGGPITRQLSSFLGESEETTRSALRTIGPTMLAGVMRQAATPTGAADVFRAVNDERIDSGIVGKLGTLLGNRGSFDSMRGVGDALTSAVFGNRSGALSDAISQVAGVRPGSVTSLLSMGLPVLFGMLRKQTSNNGLDASGLASLLFSQRGALERSGLDNRITNALGFNNLSSLLGAIPAAGAARAAEPPRLVTAAREPDRRSKGWLPWAVAAGVAALALMLLVNRTDDRADVQTARTAPPADARGERAQTATTDTSTRVYFDTGETTIDGEDRIRIASIAETARSQNREVAVTGYTDRTGDRAQNQEIAKERAVAVRDALVAEGVAESKIVLDPPAEVTGTGGDEEARRVDIDMR